MYRSIFSRQRRRSGTQAQLACRCRAVCPAYRDLAVARTMQHVHDARCVERGVLRAGLRAGSGSPRDPRNLAPYTICPPCYRLPSSLLIVTRSRGYRYASPSAPTPRRARARMAMRAGQPALQLYPVQPLFSAGSQLPAAA
jgi:hypothetical protein